MTATVTVQSAHTSQHHREDDNVIIKCLGLTKIFRDFWMRNRVCAVDHIDLTIQQGEVFGLLGPNGSGKSTTVKMILGLLHPTAGRIAVFGHHPQDVNIKKHLGYLPEESYLYPFLNARETLDYYGKLFHQNRRQRRERIDMLLEMVGLDKVARRPVGEYSKGMQRRIGLAQALINDPQVLILDEPTTGLDPIGTRQIKDLIRQLADRGKTVLLCSHLLADVEDVTDRVAIMFGGRIRKQGPVDALLTRSNLTSIQASDLSEADIEAIEQTLATRHKHIDAVEQPRQKLESLFLDIVHEAQQEGAATSGAGSGGPIAQFLVDKDSSHMPESTDPGRVLSALMEGDDKRAGDISDTGDEASAPAKPAPETSSAEPQQDVLSDLTGHDAIQPEASNPKRQKDQSGDSPKPAAGAEAGHADDAEADHSVIDSLVHPTRDHAQDDDDAQPNQP